MSPVAPERRSRVAIHLKGLATRKPVQAGSLRYLELASRRISPRFARKENGPSAGETDGSCI